MIEPPHPSGMVTTVHETMLHFKNIASHHAPSSNTIMHSFTKTVHFGGVWDGNLLNLGVWHSLFDNHNNYFIFNMGVFIRLREKLHLYAAMLKLIYIIWLPMIHQKHLPQPCAKLVLVT